MGLKSDLAVIVGERHVLTGGDLAPWEKDWTGKYLGAPSLVVEPADTVEVANVMTLLHGQGVAVTPLGGYTGVTGAGHAPGGLAMSLRRLNRIETVDREGRFASVGAGATIEAVRQAADDSGLLFPLNFGAKGSAQIGGALATNAGGSNVLRYGNARALCLGLEAVLADGRVVNLMSSLLKDNTGLDLKELLIGSEGTLGIITRAVLRLSPKPLAHATALVGVPSADDGLALLNRLQDASGGSVDAFDFMTRRYIDMHKTHFGQDRDPLDNPGALTVLIELASTSADAAETGEDGSRALDRLLESTLSDHLEAGTVTDARVASSEAQRQEMWALREAAAEVMHTTPQHIEFDISLPLSAVTTFLSRADAAIEVIDPGITDAIVGHLGDGNLHYVVFQTRGDAALADQLSHAVEELVHEMGGSFSAEHGIGKSKVPLMRRWKDPVALDMMRSIKGVLDPDGILNPGKLYPAP